MTIQEFIAKIKERREAQTTTQSKFLQEFIERAKVQAEANDAEGAE